MIHIIKQAKRMPVRLFNCHCCGTKFIADAKEAIESGPAWIVECPYCKHDCSANQSDELDEMEYRQLTWP